MLPPDPEIYLNFAGQKNYFSLMHLVRKALRKKGRRGGGWYSHRWQSEQVVVAKALEYERAVNGGDGIHTDVSQSK